MESSPETIAIRFNEAINDHDIDRLAGLMISMTTSSSIPQDPVSMASRTLSRPGPRSSICFPNTGMSSIG